MGIFTTPVSPYKVLGVAPPPPGERVDVRSLRQAFLKAAHEWHPDKYFNKSPAERAEVIPCLLSPLPPPHPL